MRSKQDKRMPRLGCEEGLAQAENNRLFRHFSPPAPDKEAWWGVALEMSHAKTYGLFAARALEARRIGHTDEYVGYVAGERRSGSARWRWSVRPFGRRGGMNTPIIAYDLSLRDAMRMLENVWMLSLLAEDFDNLEKQT